MGHCPKLTLAHYETLPVPLRFSLHLTLKVVSAFLFPWPSGFPLPPSGPAQACWDKLCALVAGPGRREFPEWQSAPLGRQQPSRCLAKATATMVTSSTWAVCLLSVPPAHSRIPAQSEAARMTATGWDGSH